MFPDSPETAIVQAATVLGIMLLAWWGLGVVRWIVVLRPASAATRQRAPTVTPSRLPGTRRLAVALITLTLPLLQACTSNPEPDAPVLVWVEDDPTETTPTTAATPATTQAPSSTSTSSSTSSSSSSSSSSPTATASTVDTPPAAEPAEFDADPTLPSASQDRENQEPATTYEVQPGDSLWAIACTHVAAEGDPPPTSSDVASYWRELIHRNRSRVASGNPDLIFPGELLDLPT